MYRISIGLNGMQYNAVVAALLATLSRLQASVHLSHVASAGLLILHELDRGGELGRAGMDRRTMLAGSKASNVWRHSTTT